MIKEAVRSGCRLTVACGEAEISLRTWRRWINKGQISEDRRPTATRPAPANKLTDSERKQITDTCNLPEYASLPPSQIVPTLLDKGTYIASESSYYRVLKEEGLLNHRGRSRAPVKRKRPETYTATGPNQVYTWDITYLPSAVRGQYYYLYMIEDIFSRKIVGYEVHENECGELASRLLQRTLLREKCLKNPPVLHSDNGAPMKSIMLKTKMEELGVTPSYSRPRVSDDNPFSESLFRTLKYRPHWPLDGFDSLLEARQWVEEFTDWYNYQHKHSGIRFVTPAQRHDGQDRELLKQRSKVLDKAKQQNPLRWSKGIRNCEPIGAVTLNPDKIPEQQIETELAA